MQMLKKLKAENEAKEAKSKEAENSKNSKSSSEKESGLAKTDEKVRKALESSEKKSSEKTSGSDDISDKTRALLEDKKSKDSSKAAPPPPPPKKPKDLDSSPDPTTNRARKSVSLGSLIGKKDPNKENGDSTDKKTDKPTTGKRSSLDKRNTNSPTGKVQSKMTSFVTKDDKKDRRDSITTGTTYL